MKRGDVVRVKGIEGPRMVVAATYEPATYEHAAPSSVVDVFWFASGAGKVHNATLPEDVLEPAPPGSAPPGSAPPGSAPQCIACTSSRLFCERCGWSSEAEVK